MTAQAWRPPKGGLIDRGRPLTFTFDGVAYAGYAGDTLASALLANGVHLVGRSFKYHRPRGILSAGAEEPNALVTLGGGGRSDPNLRATEVILRDGLTAISQNRWPSLRHDVRALGDLLSPLLVAGFYYKTFMWPKRLWRTYEHLIRGAAGMGRAPAAPDPDRYDHRHTHCDVLVVGGGPAGLAAALAAGRSGARVILAESQPAFGGALLSEPAGGGTISGASNAAWVSAVVGELADLPEVRLLPRTTVFGHYQDNFVTMLEKVTDHLAPGECPEQAPRQRLWKVRARRVVFAAGAIERPLVFPGNDRPGIMLAGAVRTYVNRFAVRPGKRAVVFTNNDSAYAAALDLHAAGVAVRAIVDLRPEATGPWVDRARRFGIPVIAGWTVTATFGRRRLRGIEIMAMSADGRAVAGQAEGMSCDVLCVSGGWNPAVHLHQQAGGRVAYDPVWGTFTPGAAAQAVASAGACNGSFALADCLAAGQAAGAEAARETGHEPPAAETFVCDQTADMPPRILWRLPVGRRGGKAFVDCQNDVCADDLELAIREGYGAVEHVKRYTTTGMGTDQGKTGNINALGIVADALGTDVPSVGVTTFRPPYTPVGLGAMAGRNVGSLYAPVRRTPMHGWHAGHGAAFENVGQWKRAWYYPQPGETMDQAVAREVRAARDSIGMLDYSTLGKIDVRGRDAGIFLDRIYTHACSRMPAGRCRYGLILGEDGMVMDDGVTARLAEDHFHLTTTTSGAATVMGWLELWLQTEWPDLKVHLTSVTEQWAVVSLCGPKCRDLLAGLCGDIDFSSDAFPFMQLRDGHIAGIPARVFRVSFTGEVSYEINVPATFGLALWEALWNAGRKHGITPYGTEAMHVLRAEKGFFIVGQETDGTVTPVDLGMGRAIANRAGDFLGRRSLALPDLARDGRKQLVGVLTEDPALVLEEGAHLVSEARVAPGRTRALGHVTSSYHSPNLGRSIALAMVAGGAGRHGETLFAAGADGRIVPVTLTSPVFVDPEGSRLRA